ncbi:MAG TPA: polysaccharide deacetylase family protein [Saprospiraceae bacterium]|nr:polysaccharide deacetylase family protein [Saprospiraceae bacterium]
MYRDSIYSYLPFKTLLYRKAIPDIIPLYHTTGFNHYLPETGFLYRNRTEKEFEQDLDFLLKRFTPVDLESLHINVSQNKKTFKPYFHITIDDGLASNYEIMAPVLYKKGIPATFFINPAFIGDQEIMHRYKASLLLDFISHYTDSILSIAEQLQVKPSFKDIEKKLLSIKYPQRNTFDLLIAQMGISWNEILNSNPLYMDMTQLGKLNENGFSLGAHSWDHPEFDLLSMEEQKQQIESSLEWINQYFRQKTRCFAFPFTDHWVSKELFEWLHTMVDLSFGTAGLKTDIYHRHLQRIPIEKSKLAMSSIIKKEALAFWIKKILGKSCVYH